MIDCLPRDVIRFTDVYFYVTNNMFFWNFKPEKRKGFCLNIILTGAISCSLLLLKGKLITVCCVTFLHKWIMCMLQIKCSAM